MHNLGTTLRTSEAQVRPRVRVVENVVKSVRASGGSITLNTGLRLMNINEWSIDVTTIVDGNKVAFTRLWLVLVCILDLLLDVTDVPYRGRTIFVVGHVV